MKKIYKVILWIFIAISILLMACDKQEKNAFDNSKAVNLSEEKATEMFQRMYGMPNLKEQRVTLSDNTLNIEFFFDKNSTESEIDSARSFTLMTFVLEKSSPYSSLPYMSLVDPALKKLSWENTICNIYKNDKKIYHEKYKGMKLEASKKY